MKVTSFKTFLFFLLVLLLTTGYLNAFAQGRNRMPERPARKELRAYYTENVLPVVRAQRQKLETQLTTEDKTALNTYRAQLQANRERSKELLRSFRATAPNQSGRPQLTDAQRQQLQQQRTDIRAVMLKVAALAQKYDTNIRQLSAEVEPQRTQWSTDTKAIMAKYTTPEQPEKLARFVGGRHGRVGDKLGHYFRPSTFLLMKPTAFAIPELATNAAASVFPNPSSATTQLEYSVAKAGPVTVELLDNHGTTLRTLINQQSKEKGAHVLVTDLADLPSGTYYYKITTRTGSETKRFLKQ